MKLQDIYHSIDEEVWMFPYRHNGIQPQCIFISKPLYQYILANEELMYGYTGDDKICKYKGIDVKIYEHSEPQYYLAAGPGRFKRYCEGAEVALYMED